MHSSLSARLHSLADWRAGADRTLAALSRWLQEHELQGAPEREAAAALHERLASDRLMVAFVAEFSRGKSELINAIFFSDAGKRVLPATPGRTTMCPVELAWEAGQAPMLSLLPIETRLQGTTLADLRGRNSVWTRIPLQPRDPDSLSQALAAVTRTRRATVDEARDLGLWSDETPADNPPQAADGTVEVPAWRHALINYPHPMLQQGLVVLDTPGLNAIGAEPELTLSLLPAADAAVFVLAADTGVTKSDMAIWREHLGERAIERFVVLNKIDALADPLATPQAVQQQIERQRQETAHTLGVDANAVFPLSARGALSARIDRNVGELVKSRVPDLEVALSQRLLPHRQLLLTEAAQATVRRLHAGALRRLGDQRRQNAEELLEMRGLRGKSGAKVRQMLERVKAEATDFERCLSRLQAVRLVHNRMLREAQAPLSGEKLRAEVRAMQPAGALSGLLQGHAGAFDALIERLRGHVDKARAQATEMHDMTAASFAQLNAEYGFSFQDAPAPDLGACRRDLERIEHRYRNHLGRVRAWRLAAPGAAEQFRRMLLSKLRVMFETASSELDVWAKGAEAQIEVQLRERRQTFLRRKESLERIQSATGELEQRITELESHDQRLRETQQRLDALVADALKALLPGSAAPAEAPAQRSAA